MENKTRNTGKPMNECSSVNDHIDTNKENHNAINAI